MASVITRDLGEKNFSASHVDCYGSQTLSKSFSGKSYSSEESSSDESCFHSNQVQARTRRNAIDFTPMDATVNDDVCEGLEYEEIDQKVMEKHSSQDSLSTVDAVKKNGGSEYLKHNSCSSIYETPIAPYSKGSDNSSQSGDSLDDLSESSNNLSIDEKSDSSSIAADKRIYFWEKEMKDMLNTDVFMNDKPIYHDFIKSCHELCNLCVVPFEDQVQLVSKDHLTFPNSVPTAQSATAKQLINQLDHCFAYMHGGRDVSNSPIICLPHFPDLRTITEEHFRDVILYLTSIASASAAEVGFVLVLDRRRDKWASLRAVLIRLAAFFPGNLKMVLVLRPVGFFQATISDIGFRFRRDEFSMKVPVTMLSTLDELYEYIQPDQLTQEFGGSYDYDHKTWIKNRVLLEDFSMQVANVGRSLETYGIQLAQSELPNDVKATEDLISVQCQTTISYKAKLEALQDLIPGLLETMQGAGGGSILPNCQNTSEFETLRSMISLVGETEAAFDKFWTKHEEKLTQCLQLRMFEQNFREARLKLAFFEQWLAHDDDVVGNSTKWVLSMMDKTKKMKENFLVCSAECSELASHGRLLIKDRYAVDCIAPKCNELLELSSKLTYSFQNRMDFLERIKGTLTSMEELNCWCDQAMSVLAGQTLDSKQTLEGMRHMLKELEDFFTVGSKMPIITSYTSTGIEASIESVNKRRDEVLRLYEKCSHNLRKSIARYTNRPVQLVEPSKKFVSSATEDTSTTEEKKEHLNTTRPRPKRVKPKSKAQNFCPKKTPTHSASAVHSDPHVSLQHAMNELLSTERAYVSELKEIVEGYGNAIDDEIYSNIVPDKLKGNRTILFGNMDDIYQFHQNTFLTELEEAKNEAHLVGECFVRRKKEFAIYAKYCQNSTQSEHLRASVGEKHPFFLECQKKLGHRLSLGAYLLKPIQRITKYQLLLQQILKYSDGDKTVLQEAVHTMLDVLKSVNDSMHQAAIVGFQGDFELMGNLVMQGALQVEHKKTKSKKPRFNKTVQRHVFLFEKELVLCKQQNGDVNSGDSASSGSTQHVAPPPGGVKGQYYQYKTSLKTNGAGITETVKGDQCKFDIWYQSREEVYTFTSHGVQTKQDWIKQIKKVLSSQPKSDTTPVEVHPADSKSLKVKRSQSLNKKLRPASMHTEKHKETKKSTLGRSASMGKGKDKILKRKNTSEDLEKLPVRSEENLIEESAANVTVKSASLPKLLDDPASLSDVDEGFDSSKTSTSDNSISGCKFVVMKETASNETGETDVVFRVGDVVQIVRTGKEGWVKVRVEQSGETGWAPANSIRSLSDASSYDSVSSYTSTC